VRGDVDANLEQHLRLIRLAAEHRAELLVFPELSLTGYELDLAADLAFSPDDTRLTPLRDLSTACAMTLIVGAPVRLESRLFIGALILSPDRTVDVYTKHHLGAFSADVNPGGAVPPAEATVFHAGTLNPLLPVGRRSAAVAVCADSFRPSHPQAASERGANTYLASMFNIPAELTSATANLAAYAVKYSMVVVLANFGGPSGGLPSGGGSAIWTDQGERLAQLDASGAGIVVATETADGWRGRAVE
jgi:predicted amidohydrolase